MDIDRELFNYATPLERRALEAIIEHGECQKADKALGRGRSYTSGCYNRVKARAAKYGYAPGTSNITARVPEGFAVKRLSARFDKEGNPAGGWLISEPEAEARIKALREVAEALAEDMPRAEPITPPELVLADLLNLYTFTDYHLGMLAWHREGGADWDLGIAERMLNGAMRAMVGRSPPAYAALLNIQGDFLHTDGNLPVTPAHQNVLDADSRYPKIRRAAIRSIRSLIDCALKAHSHVHIIVAEGNHDEAGSGWLRLARRPHCRALRERKARERRQ